ncbi:hypothetical protein ACFXGA_16735 [Actinosynnema sp. NPDC059335]|uniref:hypothetical protein n=1 Tax=Actinosynnema sp. NPDC059335 TaxID=3346804 RepID=UPI00366F087D
MTGDDDADRTGYPGFRVDDPPRLRPLPVTLRRIALAKLSSVDSFSASFGGEGFGFAPWFTVLVDYDDVLRFVGVYRGETVRDIGEREPSPEDERRLCVRHSEWDRAADVARAPMTAELGDYLASGPQITDRYAFTTTHESADLTGATAGLLADLARGFAISASPPRRSPWHHLSVEVADDLFVTAFRYSPRLARCDVLEAGLPPWLDRALAVADRGGAEPDEPIRLHVRHSVRELVNAPIRPPRRP